MHKGACLQRLKILIESLSSGKLKGWTQLQLHKLSFDPYASIMTRVYFLHNCTHKEQNKSFKRRKMVKIKMVYVSKERGDSILLYVLFIYLWIRHRAVCIVFSLCLAFNMFCCLCVLISPHFK